MSCLVTQTEIPDGEILYRYCKPNAFPAGQRDIPAGIFNDPELSCDWERYRKDPFTSIQIAEGKTRVIQITVCDAIRNPTNPKNSGLVEPEWRQDIIHSPVTAKDDPVYGANQAHSLIRGKKRAAVQEAIKDNAQIYDI